MLEQHLCARLWSTKDLGEETGRQLHCCSSPSLASKLQRHRSTEGDIVSQRRPCQGQIELGSSEPKWHRSRTALLPWGAVGTWRRLGCSFKMCTVLASEVAVESLQKGKELVKKPVGVLAVQ